MVYLPRWIDLKCAISVNRMTIPSIDRSDDCWGCTNIGFFEYKRSTTYSIAKASFKVVRTVPRKYVYQLQPQDRLLTIPHRTSSLQGWLLWSGQYRTWNYASTCGRMLTTSVSWKRNGPRKLGGTIAMISFNSPTVNGSTHNTEVLKLHVAGVYTASCRGCRVNGETTASCPSSTCKFVKENLAEWFQLFIQPTTPIRFPHNH